MIELVHTYTYTRTHTNAHTRHTHVIHMLSFYRYRYKKMQYKNPLWKPSIYHNFILFGGNEAYFTRYIYQIVMIERIISTERTARCGMEPLIPVWVTVPVCLDSLRYESFGGDWRFVAHVLVRDNSNCKKYYKYYKSRQGIAR